MIFAKFYQMKINFSFCQKLKHKYSFDNYKERVQKPDCIEPYYFTSLLTKLLKENDILVMANGSACVCTFQNAVIKKGANAPFFFIIQDLRHLLLFYHLRHDRDNLII